MANTRVESSLQLKKNTYNGKDYYQLVGSCEMKGKKMVGVSIACDESGSPQVYETQKGKQYVYANFFTFTKQSRAEKRVLDV